MRSVAVRTSTPRACSCSSKVSASRRSRASSAESRCWTKGTRPRTGEAQRGSTRTNSSHRRRPMLSYNVATLLRSAPGTERRYPVEAVRMDIADDVRLAEPIEGEVRLSRTGRSILARAHLTTAIEGYCSRCLKQVVAPIDVDIEEEALPLIDIDTGLPLDMGDEPDA